MLYCNFVTLAAIEATPEDCSDDTVSGMESVCRWSLKEFALLLLELRGLIVGVEQYIKVQFYEKRV